VVSCVIGTCISTGHFGKPAARTNAERHPLCNAFSESRFGRLLIVLFNFRGVVVEVSPIRGGDNDA